MGSRTSGEPGHGPAQEAVDRLLDQGGLSEMIISLYAGGLTIRDIQAHLERTLGTELSPRNDFQRHRRVAEEVKLWQSRPLESLYPIVYMDALIVKVRDGHAVRNKAAHIAVGDRY
jgi:putative transposase